MKRDLTMRPIAMCKGLEIKLSSFKDDWVRGYGITARRILLFAQVSAVIVVHEGRRKCKPPAAAFKMWRLCPAISLSGLVICNLKICFSNKSSAISACFSLIARSFARLEVAFSNFEIAGSGALSVYGLPDARFLNSHTAGHVGPYLWRIILTYWLPVRINSDC